MKLAPVANGEWIAPTPRRGYLMQCCDCGLIHRLNFDLIPARNGAGKRIVFQAFRVEEEGGEWRYQGANGHVYMERRL